MLGRALTIFVQSVKNDLRRIEERGKIKAAVPISTHIQTICLFTYIYDICYDSLGILWQLPIIILMISLLYAWV